MEFGLITVEFNLITVAFDPLRHLSKQVASYLSYRERITWKQMHKI